MQILKCNVTVTFVYILNTTSVDYCTKLIFVMTGMHRHMNRHISPSPHSGCSESRKLDKYGEYISLALYASIALCRDPSTHHLDG